MNWAAAEWISRLTVLRVVVLATLTWAGLLPVGSCSGATHAFGVPAAGSPSKQNALTLTIEYEHSLSYGYQAVHATFNAKAAKADRSITLRITPYQNMPGRSGARGVSVEQDVDLPAGKTKATLELLVPKFNPWQVIATEVWVDGVVDRELSAMQPTQTSSGTPHTLEVLRPFSKVTNPSIKLSWGGTLGFEYDKSNIPIAYHNHPLPDTWQALTCYDAVAMRAEELISLAKRQPEQLAVVRRWVRAGGLLVVEHVGEQLELLPAVDELLNDSSLPFDLQLAQRQQEEPQEEDTPGEASEQEDIEAVEAPISPPHAEAPDWRWVEIRLPRLATARQDSLGDTDGSGRPRRMGQPTPGWFAETHVGFGAVVAFSQNASSIPKSFLQASGIRLADRRALSRELFRYLQGHCWPQRHGLSPDQGNQEFSNWLIPGVGAAPVDAFRWLITLFVLLIGPVSLFLLRLRHRTHLIVLTAPVAAVAFTLCLFVYATFSDGFGARARIRSVTFLDQQRQECVSWSRQTFYAGLAPAEGLTYSRDALVYPLLSPWREDRSSNTESEVREILVRPSSMQLSNGWLRSRETSQYLVIQSGECHLSMQVSQQGDALEAENRLGAEVERMYAVDADGGWWTVGVLASGAQSRLRPITKTEVVSQLRQLLSEAAPAYPPGLEPGDWRRRNRAARRSNFSDDYEPGEAAMKNGRLARLISQIAGIEGGLPVPLGAGAYLAITRQAVAVDVGLEEATEQGSLHLTLGRWSP